MTNPSPAPSPRCNIIGPFGSQCEHELNHMGWHGLKQIPPSETLEYIDKLEDRIESLTALNAELREGLATYGQHDMGCILRYWEAGEPTKDGYRTMYKGKWYQTKPVDKTPKCQCGLDALLRKATP